MKNNQSPPLPLMQQTNVVYEYKCNQDDCAHLPQNSYVGLTTTSLSRRITMHLRNGAPKLHAEASHPHPEHPNVRSLTREMMVNNTKVIRRKNNK